MYNITHSKRDIYDNVKHLKICVDISFGGFVIEKQFKEKHFLPKKRLLDFSSEKNTFKFNYNIGHSLRDSDKLARH